MSYATIQKAAATAMRVGGKFLNPATQRSLTLVRQGEKTGYDPATGSDIASAPVTFTLTGGALVQAVFTETESNGTSVKVTGMLFTIEVAKLPNELKAIESSMGLVNEMVASGSPWHAVTPSGAKLRVAAVTPNGPVVIFELRQ